MVSIRTADYQDYDAITALYLRSFSETESNLVEKLATELLIESTAISLVAEKDKQIMGHIAFSPVTIVQDDRLAYILAPLAVLTEYQKQKIGTQLIQTGKDKLLSLSVNILFVYGDPKYYARFGFKAENAASFTAPHPLAYPLGWQAMMLTPSTDKDNKRLHCVKALDKPELW